MSDRWLAGYLQDHDAGAAAGLALFRRVAGGHTNPHVRRVVGELVPQIERDRAALRDTMAALGIRPSRVKPALAVAGERAGRLKPNGRLVSRSPLSDVIELEALQLGVAGKAAGWRLLRMVAESNDRLDASWFDELTARADDQAEVLEQLRLEAAAAVFAG